MQFLLDTHALIWWLIDPLPEIEFREFRDGGIYSLERIAKDSPKDQ